MCCFLFQTQIYEARLFNGAIVDGKVGNDFFSGDEYDVRLVNYDSFIFFN